ncbi:MAG: SulP family inorganic anion transporter [Natronospirillum sp.]
MWQTVRTNWFSNVRGDVLAAIVVALALIPEAVAFSIIAGVDPKVGLYASFCILVVTAFMGGRPGMISAATGAMALLMVTLVRDHGLEYLFAATVLTGILQVVAGYLKLANLMRFVSRSVVTGFVNALAILIFLAQVPEFTGDNFSLTVVLFIAAGLVIIYGLPYITKVVPSPLVALVALTVVAIYFGVDLRTVGDMGDLPDTLPVFLIPDIPLNLETLMIIFPYSITMAVVGLLESMMTATIVDDLTDTPSDKNRESKGQGYANVVTGFFGGMAGCAMIGQSIINIKSGGRTRLSTLLAGLFLLFLIVALGPWVSQIPMGALVAVMIMVSIGTFSWSSLTDLKKHPLSTNIVMVVTVVVVVYTHNLAIGVFVGILLAAMFFANKVGHYMHVSKELDSTGTERRYLVVGQVFFSSSDKFISSFDFKEAIEKVVIDLSHAHFWDITAVGALDKVVLKLRREGTEVEVIGLNEASETIVDRFGEHDKPGALDKLLSGH